MTQPPWEGYRFIVYPDGMAVKQGGEKRAKAAKTLTVTLRPSPPVSRYTTGGWDCGLREATVQNMTAIAFAIFAALLLAAVVILVLAIITSLTVIGALVLLAVVDAVILIGGYLIIRRAASSST